MRGAAGGSSYGVFPAILWRCGAARRAGYFGSGWSERPAIGKSLVLSVSKVSWLWTAPAAMMTSPRLSVVPLRVYSRLNSPARRAAGGVIGTCWRLAKNSSVAASSLDRIPASTSVMLMWQHANIWPNFTRSKSRAGRPRLLLSASMMTLVSRRKVAISAAGYFLEALVVFLAQLFDPLGSSLLEFGMVLVLPGAGRGFRGFDLAEAHQFLFRRLGQKSAAPALADEGVDLGRSEERR